MDIVITGDYKAFTAFLNKKVQDLYIKIADEKHKLQEAKDALKQAQADKKTIGRKSDEENKERHDLADEQIVHIKAKIEKHKKTIESLKNESKTWKSYEKMEPVRLKTGGVIPSKPLIEFEKKLKNVKADITITHSVTGLVYSYENRRTLLKGKFTVKVNTYLTELLQHVALPTLDVGVVEETR